LYRIEAAVNEHGNAGTNVSYQRPPNHYYLLGEPRLMQALSTAIDIVWKSFRGCSCAM
jgi:hypothetical protein